jgi:hypothetical protein
LFEGLAFGGCKVGDKIVLVVGLQRPLIVRDDDNHEKIIGFANFSHKKMDIEFWNRSWRLRDCINYGKIWRAYDKKGKENWKGESYWTDSEAEPYPLTYFEDILIS